MNCTEQNTLPTKKETERKKKSQNRQLVRQTKIIQMQKVCQIYIYYIYSDHRKEMAGEPEKNDFPH